MKIGDKVRFLSETGGGTVKGFKDKNVVWIEDEEGFDIPMLIKECVVVQTDEYNIPVKPASHPTASAEEEQTDDKEDDSDIPITYRAPEIEGNDRLNAHLAFVPQSIKALSNTSFDAYLINDSNYLIDYLYLSAEGKDWTLRSRGTVMPNMKEHLEEFDQSMLNEHSHVCIRLLPYKDRRTFTLKPVIDADIWINVVQFYKLNTFRPSEFFAEPALIYDLAKDDEQAHELQVSTGDLKRAMLEKNDTPPTKKSVPHTPHKVKNDIIEVDLHIHELLDDTGGMSNSEMLNYQLDVFRKYLDGNKNHKGQKIVFIHGKGDGVLRRAILNELKHKYRNYDYQDASFREYGFGATMVTIR